MASKKHFAGIDFQGGASIKVGGTAGNNQFLKASSDGALSWASGTTSASGMGDVGITNYEGLIHSGITSSQNANFALAQSSGGLTVLNSKAGKGLYLRTEGGSSATDQIIIDGGTLSFQGSIGSEGNVLTVNSSNKAAWAAPSGANKKTYEFRWDTSSPPTGCSFHNTNLGGSSTKHDTVRLTHTFGEITIVNMIDVNDLFGSGLTNYGLQMGYDVSVSQGNNTMDIILTGIDAVNVPTYSSNKNFKVIIMG